MVRAQLRRATERYGPLNSKVVSCALSLPLAREIHPQQSGNRVTGSFHIENLGNINPEAKAKMDSVPKCNDSHSITDQFVPESGRLSNSSASAEAHLSNDIDAEKGHKSATKSLEEIKKPDSVVIPNDFLCPISLELMRDPVIVATGQVYFTILNAILRFLFFLHFHKNEGFIEISKRYYLCCLPSDHLSWFCRPMRDLTYRDG